MSHHESEESRRFSEGARLLQEESRLSEEADLNRRFAGKKIAKIEIVDIGWGHGELVLKFEDGSELNAHLAGDDGCVWLGVVAE